MANYLVLLSLAKPNRATVQRTESALRKIDDAAKIVWMDSAYAGYALTTTLPARDIAQAAFAKADDYRDGLVIEIGNQWWAAPDSKAYHWLSTRWFNHPDTPG